MNLHGHFRRQEKLVAVNGRGKLHALFGDLAKTRQRKDLKAPRVRQNGLIPTHKTVKTAVLFNHVKTGAQPQVKGIAQNDLAFNFFQFTRRHGLNGTVRAHRHKDRCLHRTVIELHFASASFARGFL